VAFCGSHYCTPHACNPNLVFRASLNSKYMNIITCSNINDLSLQERLQTEHLAHEPLNNRGEQITNSQASAIRANQYDLIYHDAVFPITMSGYEIAFCVVITCQECWSCRCLLEAHCIGIATCFAEFGLEKKKKNLQHVFNLRMGSLFSKWIPFALRILRLTIARCFENASTPNFKPITT
jgi:hypothetical protein